MRIILVTLLFLLFGTSAFADCNIKSGSINILANDFPALRTFVETSKQCKGSADFKVTHSSEHNKIAVPALTANPSEFSARIAANSSIVPLMNQDLIRPLDDLVKKYGKGIQDSQLITIDGKVMAVAFMANTQHLYYREDVLKDLGIAVPKTYEEVFAASEKIRSESLVAKAITVFVRTSPFQRNFGYYSNSKTLDFPIATNNSIETVKAAMSILDSIFRNGYRYQKAGVMLTGLSNEEGKKNLFYKVSSQQFLY